MVETWFKELRMHNGHVLIFMLTLCDSPVLLLIMRCVIYCCDYRLGLSTGKFQSMKLTTNIATPVTCLISFLSWLCFSVPMDVHTTITGLLWHWEKLKMWWFSGKFWSYIKCLFYMISKRVKGEPFCNGHLGQWYPRNVQNKCASCLYVQIGQFWHQEGVWCVALIVAIKVLRALKYLNCLCVLYVRASAVPTAGRVDKWVKWAAKLQYLISCCDSIHLSLSPLPISLPQVLQQLAQQFENPWYRHLCESWPALTWRL